jgi:hypothetical protein
MAFGLSRFGLGGDTATAAALSFHALETFAAAAFGLCGLALAHRPRRSHAPWLGLRSRAVAALQRP